MTMITLFKSAFILAGFSLLSATPSVKHDFGPLATAVESDTNLKTYLTELKNGRNAGTEDEHKGLFDFIKTRYLDPKPSPVLGRTLFVEMCSPKVEGDEVLSRAVVLTVTAALLNPTNVNFKENYLETNDFCSPLTSSYGNEVCMIFSKVIDAAMALRQPKDVKLDLKDVAVVLGDHWISSLVVNGRGYEGASAIRMARFVGKVLNSLQLEDEKITELSKRFDDIARFGSFIHIRPSLISQKLIARAFHMYIELMQPGESVLLPFGWAGITNKVTLATSGGHAMLVEFLKTSETETDLTIYNTGDGIGAHPKRRVGEITRYAPNLEYNRIEVEALKRYSFFEGLISLDNPVEVTPNDPVTADDIYRVLMRPFLNQISERVPSVFIKDQKAGTCTFTVLTAHLITKLDIKDFRAIRRRLDIEGWEAGYAIVPDKGHEEIKREILQRGMQTIARRLYRHSKRGDFLGDQVNMLHSMHQRLKGVKLTKGSETRLPKLEPKDLIDKVEDVKSFLEEASTYLMKYHQSESYKGGFELPHFEKGLVSFLEACKDIIGNDKDLLLWNDEDFTRHAVIQAIIKDLPDLDSEYWKGLDAAGAKANLEAILSFTRFFAVKLGVARKASYSGLLAITKLYLSAWVCAKKANSELFEGFRPSMVYIKNALDQASIFPLKPAEEEIMSNLLNWISKLEGDEIFDYTSWKTNDSGLIFETEDQKQQNSELKLVKNIQSLVLKSGNFETIKNEVTESVLNSVRRAKLESINEGTILGYLWASRSATEFNIMRDIAIFVMTYCNNTRGLIDLPAAYNVIDYLENEKSEYQVLLELADENITGLKTTISSQELYFTVDKQLASTGQNDIIAKMGDHASSIECVKDSDLMRILNLISYYTNEPNTVLKPVGIELLVGSILDPKYNSNYMASVENSRNLLEFIDYLVSFVDKKMKAEGKLNSSTTPIEFEALLALLWVKSKVLTLMHSKGHLADDIHERKIVRQRLEYFLSMSQDFDKSFISDKASRNLLHMVTALTYTKEDLMDIKMFEEFLKHAVKVSQATTNTHAILLVDFWGLMVELEPLLKSHAKSVDISKFLNVFPDFKSEITSFQFPVLHLQSAKDSSGNYTAIRLNVLSGFYTVNGSPSRVQFEKIFRQMNLDPKLRNFETSLSGSDVILGDKNGTKLAVRNNEVFYLLNDGTFCQAINPLQIQDLNKLGIFAPRLPNKTRYDIWICPVGSSTGAILTDGELKIVVEVSSEGKVTLCDSAVVEATVMKPVPLFENFELQSAVTLYSVPKSNNLIFSFTRYVNERYKRLTLTADTADLETIIFEQEYRVSSDQSLHYDERFGRYLIVEKISGKAKSPALKILIPFFDVTQRQQEPKVGGIPLTCHFMDLNADRTVKPLTRTHTLVLAHQLLWTGSYLECFNLLQTADQNSKLNDSESKILASIIMYPNFALESRPEALAVTIHALAYFYKMDSIFDTKISEERYSSFKTIIESKYEDIKSMVHEKLQNYYSNENNIPVEMRIFNQKQAVTSVGWLDMQMMKSQYLKFKNQDVVQLSPRFSLRHLPKYQSTAFSDMHRLVTVHDPSSPYSLFRPSEGSFCTLGSYMYNSSMLSFDDIHEQSTMVRLSHSREEGAVQGMRQVLSGMSRETLVKGPLKKRIVPVYNEPKTREGVAFDLSQVTAELSNKPVDKIKVEIDEEDVVVDLPKVNLENIEEAEKVYLEQSCEEDGYCLHRYGWFNEEIEKGRHAYMEKSKNAEMYIRKLSDIFEAKEVMQNLTDKLKAAISKESETTRNTWATVKKLSVEILQSSPGSEAYFMKIGRMSVKPTKRNLNDAFIRESMNDYLEIYPGATEEQIREIHGQIGTFYASQTRLQHFQRALKLVEKIQKSSGVEVHSHKHEKRLALIRALKEELIDKAERAYRIDEFPVFAVFESFANVRLRRDQVEVLQTLLTKTSGHDFDSRIVQMMMSGGKTFVLGTLLAFCKADGYHLSTIIVPQSLFETNYLDMKDRSWRFFHQPCFPFTFDRSYKSTSEDHLKVLIQKLYSVIKHRGYIITTPQSMQNLANTFTEYLTITAPDFGIHPVSIKLIKDLVNIFLTRGAATFDEIDLNFVPTKELNFPTSEKKGPDEAVLGTMKRVFYWIATDAVLASKLNVLRNRQALLEPSEHPGILKRLVDLLYKDFSQDKSHRNEYSLPEKLDEKEFVNFMISKSHDTPTALISSTYLEKESTQASGGLQRLLELHYILHTDLLQSLTRTVNLHFGPSIKHPEVMIAKPFVAANTPSETSDFAGKWETVCKTFIMYLNNGICMDYDENRLSAFMKFLQGRAKHEAIRTGESDLAKTKAAVYFSNATGEDLFFTSLSSSAALEKLHKKATDKSDETIEMVLEFVHSQVLMPLRVHLNQIYSFPLNVPSMFRSTQGYSGTIDEIFNFPHEIIFPGKNALLKGNLVSDKVKFDAGSSGWIITNLIREDNRLLISDLSDEIITIPEIMGMAKEISDNHRVLIDLGALFKGTSNLQVAKGLAQYFEGQENNEICAIIFFDNFTDRLMFIKVGEDEIKEIAGTSSDIIRSTTKLPHSKLFTYLDNNHFTGVDILQTFDSRAILTTSAEFTARDMVQAIMRMRGFLKMQRADFLVTKDLKSYMVSKNFELSLTGLVTMSVRNSIELEQKYYERAGFQKLTDFYRRYVLKKIVTSERPSNYGEMYSTLKDLFQRSSEKIYYNLTFGSFAEEKITKIMEEYSKTIVTRFEPFVTAEEFAFLKSTTDEIISQGERFITKKQPFKNESSLSFDSEATVEVSSQIETEQQMEQNTTTINAVNQEELYVDNEWGSIYDSKLESGRFILGIEDAIKLSGSYREYLSLFDPKICVTANYLYYLKAKVSLFDENQKQIHSLLVVVDKSKPKEIKYAIVLANKEADELGDILGKAELYRYDAYLVDVFGSVIVSKGGPSAAFADDLKTLLLDVNLLSGNIGNLGHPSFSTKLKNWATLKSGPKLGFINEVVKKFMKPRSSEEIGMSRAYQMLKENSGGDFSVVTTDIFSQQLTANRIDDIYSSILEHTSYFGIQCHRFTDYLTILETLSKVVTSNQTETFEKICGIIVPKLADQCALEDGKALALLESAKYIHDGRDVVKSLKKLAARKPEYQIFFDDLVRSLMRPEVFGEVKSHDLKMYYAELIFNDESTCNQFIEDFQSINKSSVENFIICLFVASQNKVVQDHFKPVQRITWLYFLDQSPGDVIRALAGTEALSMELSKEVIKLIKTGLISQKIAFGNLAGAYRNDNGKMKQIIPAEETEEIFSNIYFSGQPVTKENRDNAWSCIKYVYRESPEKVFEAVLKLAGTNMSACQMALDEVMDPPEFEDRDYRDFLDKLLDLVNEIEELKDYISQPDSTFSKGLLNYLTNEYPLYPSTLQKMLLKPDIYPTLPVLEYAAKTFVTDKSFLQFLDGFLLNKPKEMHHYVGSCIRAGSLEYLRLKSFVSLHYIDGVFDFDYFLKDYAPPVEAQ